MYMKTILLHLNLIGFYATKVIILNLCWFSFQNLLPLLFLRYLSKYVYCVFFIGLKVFVHLTHLLQIGQTYNKFFVWLVHLLKKCNQNIIKNIFKAFFIMLPEEVYSTIIHIYSNKGTATSSWELFSQILFTSCGSEFLLKEPGSHFLEAVFRGFLPAPAPYYKAGLPASAPHDVDY